MADADTILRAVGRLAEAPTHEALWQREEAVFKGILMPSIRSTLHRHSAPLHLADDAWQEALSRIKSLVDGRLPNWNGADHCLRYMHRLARNVASDTFRRERRHWKRRVNDDHLDYEAPVSEASLNKAVIDGEVRCRIEAYVSELDEPDRTIFLMVYRERKTIDQIARLVRLPRTTVHSKLKRVRTAIIHRFLHGQDT